MPGEGEGQGQGQGDGNNGGDLNFRYSDQTSMVDFLKDYPQ